MSARGSGEKDLNICQRPDSLIEAAATPARYQPMGSMKLEPPGRKWPDYVAGVDAFPPLARDGRWRPL